MTDDFGRYLKQEIESSADERFKRVLWHPEDSSKLILATACECRFPPSRISPICRASPTIPTNLRMGNVGVNYHVPKGFKNSFGYGWT